jgi:hypothetical protein
MKQTFHTEPFETKKEEIEVVDSESPKEISKSFFVLSDLNLSPILTNYSNKKNTTKTCSPLESTNKSFYSNEIVLTSPTTRSRRKSSKTFLESAEIDLNCENDIKMESLDDMNLFLQKDLPNHTYDGYNINFLSFFQNETLKKSFKEHLIEEHASGISFSEN